MKKLSQLLLVVFTLMLLNLNSASALIILDDWSLDATTFGGGSSGPIEKILFQSPGTGSTNIVQNLGGNNQIDNGDTFTETLWMSADEYNQTGGFGTTDLNLGQTFGVDNHLLVVVSASGKVVDYVTDNDYGYTLSGTVNFYIDDDEDWSAFSGNPEFGAAPTLVASSTISDAGKAGTADGFLGTNLGNAFSNWAVGIEFDWMLAGMWLDASNNNLLTPTRNVVGDAQGTTRLNSRTFAPDTIIFAGSTGDDMKIGITVIPEPSTLILLGLGLLSVAGVGRRKFN